MFHVELLQQMDEVLNAMDSILLPSSFLLVGLRKAVLNGFKHATFTPNFYQHYYPLRENPDDVYLTPALLRHHNDQLIYLLDKAKSGKLQVWEHSSRPEFRNHSALSAYLSPLVTIAGELLSAMTPDLDKAAASIGMIPNWRGVLNKRIYQRPFFIDIKSPSPPKWLFINSDKAVSDAQSRRQYIDTISAAYERHRIVYLDNFLSSDALEELYQYCMESTIWHIPKRSYVGSYQREGFSHPMLVEIAVEMAKTFPFIGEKPLVQMWAYNFEQTMSREGILLHMDSARVNLNLWLVPDEANLDPASGGLVVYTRSFVDHIRNNSHRNYTFADIQSESVGSEFVSAEPHLNYTIPYRRNRIVIFDSILWHMTDTMNFKKGFKNRRINLTFLFGRSVLDEVANYVSG